MGRVKASPAPVIRILGIDPGTVRVGWGVVEVRGTRLACLGHGTLRAVQREAIDLRLRTIAAGLREVIEAWSPTEVALEEAFYGRDARAAQRIGEGRGALVLVAAEAGLPVAHYANNVVKKAVTGVGRATKQQVQAMVQRVLGMPREPSGLDATDALALAICHHQRRGRPQSGGGLPPRVVAAVKAARRRPPR
jgi:crossover junction endodeoxyribonuclease RuvC